MESGPRDNGFLFHKDVFFLENESIVTNVVFLGKEMNGAQEIVGLFLRRIRDLLLNGDED